MLLLARHGVAVVRVAFDVRARQARPGATEAAHAGADVEEERLALLFAVVADVDAGFALLAHDMVQRGSAGCGEFRVHRFAAVLAHVKLYQRLRARQAARVGGQDTGLAGLHGVSPGLVQGTFHPVIMVAQANCILRPRAEKRSAFRQGGGGMCFAFPPLHRRAEAGCRYEAWGEAASSRSIGSQTNAVCGTFWPANWIIASATGLPPRRW